MKHPRYIWLAFLLFLAVVLTAMGWISVTAVRVDRDARRHEAEARRQEAQGHRRKAWDDQVRLALWRMDLALAPLIAQESVRPYFAYTAFLPVDRAYSRMFNDRGGGEMLIPSPLLSQRPPSVRVHFQFEPDGQLTSPQVPVQSNFKLAVPNHVSNEAVERARAELDRVAELVDRNKLLALLPESAPNPVEMVMAPLVQTAEQRDANRKRQLDLVQQGRAAVEFGQRSQAIANNTNVMAQNQEGNWFNNPILPATDVSGVLMTPLWIDGQLLLARRISAGGREYVQGCLLDWPAIKESLLETVEDLLPDADLEPVPESSGEDQAHLLAAMRVVRLLPGEPSPGMLNLDLTSGGPGIFSPIVWSLSIAWVCVLLAAAAVAGLLWGVIRLSERRAAFVTAVTHELRTPLTTFQMYAEMLAEGMVSDEQQRQSYLNTLRLEATRLTHLVENVLSYARLERGRADGRVETVALDRLITQVQDRLADRAGQAGMELVVDGDGEARGTAVRMNLSAAEQILFNLVDNASKYAPAASDKRIHLTLQQAGGAVEVHLRDHGPGVSLTARRRLFHAFSKSAHEAAHSAPGVGLGLALSRRLARDMGGDLRLDENGAEGACFVLTLAVAETV